MNTKGFRGLWAIGLAIILIVGLAIGVSADLGKVYLGWINATRLTVTDTTTLTGAVTTGGDLLVGDDLTVSDGLAVTGDQSLTGALGVTGNTTLAGELKFTAPNVITVTANSTIATAGYTSIKLAAAGTVGTATITGCSTAGKVTILRNTTNQTITITDTSTIMLAGNAALGQYDTLTLLGDGTNCLQISKADN
jgi:hypothetical protein